MSLDTILLVHNRYRQPGGEDVMFEQEGALLEARGHRVVRVEVTNEELESVSRPRLAGSLIWSRDSVARVRQAVERSGAEIAHFHNTMPLISPAAYYGARSAGAAVVQTLHNYRLICPGGQLLRDGKPCDVCVGSPVGWRGVVHGCYRGSRAASAGIASMVATHRLLGTWKRQVDAYIALGKFPRNRFIEGGLPADRVHIRPNFIGEDPGVGDHRGGFALFVARLSEQKGVRVLVDAWRRLERPIPLKIVGSGEMDEAAIGSAPGVEWLGYRSKAEVLRLMKSAEVLVFASLSYENSPLVVLEAFATGLPVVAARIDGLPSIVRQGRTGLLFESGSAESLAAAIRQAMDARQSLPAMGAAARAEYERHYDAQRGYASLLRVYERAREHYESEGKHG